MRKILSIIFVFSLLFVSVGCKKSGVLLAKVNGEKVEVSQKLYDVTLEKNKMSEIIDKLLEERLLIQKGRELGKFDEEELNQRVEKLRNSLAFNVYITDIRDNINISDEQVKQLYESRKTLQDKKYEDVESSLRNEIIGRKVDEKLTEKGNKLRGEHKVQINEQYLDFEKYSPMKSSLVVAVIDEEAKITNNELNRYFTYQKRKGHDITLKELLEQLIARKIIFLEINDLVSEKRIKKSIETFKRRQVLQYMRRQYLFEDNPITQENVKKFYDEHQDDLYSKPERVDIRHILFDSPEKEDEAKAKEAQALLDEILKSKNPVETFRLKAREYQKGPEIIKDVAGRLGPITKKVMPAPFTQAAFGLKTGEIYQGIVFTKEYGYHLLMCEEKLPAEVTPFKQDDVAEDMKRYIRDVEYRNFLSDLAEKADIRIIYPDYKGRYAKNEEK